MLLKKSQITSSQEEHINEEENQIVDKDSQEVRKASEHIDKQLAYTVNIKQVHFLTHPIQ
jgi:hypothetical protein